MPRALKSTFSIVAVCAAMAGCQSAPVRYANDGVHATYSVAATGASAVRATGGELYVGAGDAVRRPLHDFNMMQDKIAPVLLRAEAHPYDLRAVNSCDDVLDRVAELDLALGPDVDTPKEKRHTRMVRGADFAAEAALDAAGSAAEHFLPMRSTIKQLSGAQRYENHVRHAQLAGTTRRSFLKAIGMEHNCVWPAAPLDFAPTQVADAAAPWAGPAASSTQTGGGPVRTAPLPVLVAQRAAAPASLQAVPAARSSVAPHVVLVSAAHASASHQPVFVPVRDRLAIPAAEPVTVVADQAWRPAPASSDVVQISTPVASRSVATGRAAAPWSAAFGGTAAARP